MPVAIFQVLRGVDDPIPKAKFLKVMNGLKVPYHYNGKSIVSIGDHFRLNMDDNENLGGPCISISFEGSSSEQKNVQAVLQACKTLGQLVSAINSFL
jgi:hypothetical protein